MNIFCSPLPEITSYTPAIRYFVMWFSLPCISDRFFPTPNFTGVTLHRMCVWAWHSWCKTQPVLTWMCLWAWQMTMGRRQISVWAWSSSSWYELYYHRQYNCVCAASGAYCCRIIIRFTWTIFQSWTKKYSQLYTSYACVIQRTQYLQISRFCAGVHLCVWQLSCGWAVFWSVPHLLVQLHGEPTTTKSYIYRQWVPLTCGCAWEQHTVIIATLHKLTAWRVVHVVSIFYFYTVQIFFEKT